MEKLGIILALLFSCLLGMFVGALLTITTGWGEDILPAIMQSGIGAASLVTVSWWTMEVNRQQAKKQRDHNEKMAEKQKEYNLELLEREEKWRTEVARWEVKSKHRHGVKFEYTPENESLLIELLNRGIHWVYEGASLSTEYDVEIPSRYGMLILRKR